MPKVKYSWIPWFPFLNNILGRSISEVYQKLNFFNLEFWLIDSFSFCTYILTIDIFFIIFYITLFLFLNQIFFFKNIIRFIFICAFIFFLNGFLLAFFGLEFFGLLLILVYVGAILVVFSCFIFIYGVGMQNIFLDQKFLFFSNFFFFILLVFVYIYF